MPEHETAAIARQLQGTLSELKETKNRDRRLALLRHMRLLLLEADRVVDEARPSPGRCRNDRDYTHRPGQGRLLW